MFCNEDGSALHPSRFTRRFVTACERAGVPKIRLHDLRHTWATLALQAGIHPKVVSERLGHATTSITLDIYSHVQPELDAHAATAVAELFGEKKPIKQRGASLNLTSLRTEMFRGERGQLPIRASVGAEQRVRAASAPATATTPRDRRRRPTTGTPRPRCVNSFMIPTTLRFAVVVTWWSDMYAISCSMNVRSSRALRAQSRPRQGTDR